jgi:intracellular sulfur oxidation DsrE/DsrF family protein
MRRKNSKRDPVSSTRRQLLAAAAGAVAAGITSRAHAQKDDDSLRFPGDDPKHKVVYQFNKADADYHNHVIFSVGAMLRQYNDDIRIAVTAIGPGIHILLKKPGRPVSQVIREKVSSLAEYGVQFHACGNTLTALKLAETDLLPFAKLVPVGAADLMELQEQGYAYISW